MSKEIIINATHQETRIALLSEKKVSEFFFERNADKGIVGNIYKGKVVRVLPGMQAAFVDIGHERAAFLYAGDFFKSKYNVDDVDSDDEESLEEEGHKRRRRGWEEVPPIAQLVREGQELMVQVAKGPIGTKGARLTCHLSLPGRNVVFMPSLKHNGVSRKIESYEQRRRLKKIIDQFRSREGGFIIRTAASSGMSERQIRSDVEYLLNLWKKIQRNYQSNGAPKLLHYDLDLTTRVIRDFVDDEIDRIVVDSAREHRRVLRFIRNFNPELREKVELLEEPTPIFDKYNIEPEVTKALSKRVWLKSGGYLIIETTEALTSIDVNTGRFVGKKTLEETILKTNLEAAEEIVKQLRLRNIGGIIIIDFIDMEKDSSKENVYRFLDDMLREDKSRTTVLKISNLGLVEMTRKRSRESVLRYMTEQCPTCEGKGFVKSKVALAHQVLRDIRRALPELPEDHLYVSLHPDVLSVLNQYEEDTIIALEKQFQKGVKMTPDPSFHIEQIAIGPTPWSKTKATASPLTAKKKAPEQEEEEDDEAEYQRDVHAIHEAKEARKREAEARAAATHVIPASVVAASAKADTLADDLPPESSGDFDAEDDVEDEVPHVADTKEIDAPIIRTRSEADLDDEADDTEIEDADGSDDADDPNLDGDDQSNSEKKSG